VALAGVPHVDAAHTDGSASVAKGPIAASGTDLDGNPFVMDAPLPTLAWSPKTISVVLPCAEEREYALKTVKSVFGATPPDVLQEIIVVDDGSNPPLAQTHFPKEVQNQYKVRMLRHEQTDGLIGAKKTGGDAAVGDIVVFFDCHVAPQMDWHKSFLRLIGENWRRLVVPQITSLDIDTWTQKGDGGGMAKCYLTWDADFKWYDSNDPYIAVISGGLLGMSRRWWRETGGYDSKMKGWGGENLDQSLRVWLCGGEIVNAADTQVAHMWRVGNDARTGSRYKRVGDTGANRARAVYAWYGEFDKKLDHYSSFASRKQGIFGSENWYGNLDNMFQVRDRLKCRPFSWFLRRFADIYEDAGLIPVDIFMLQEKTTGKCLRYSGASGTSGSGSGSAALADCREDDDRVFWHLGNKGNRHKCCSGLRAWNTDQCLQDADSSFSTTVCGIAGTSQDQFWSLTGGGQLRRNGVCVTTSGWGGGSLQAKPCTALHASGDLGKWQKLHSREPLETQLYHKARADHPDMFGLLDRQLEVINAASDPCAKEQCFQLFQDESLNSCLDQSMHFTNERADCFSFKHIKGSLRSSSDGYCVDTMNDRDALTWGFYGCHDGSTQQFIQAESASSFCNTLAECFVYAPVKTVR